MSVLNLMLATESVVGTIIFIATLLAIISIFVIRMILVSRNKKELYKELKIGTYIITVSGICGKIVGIKQIDDLTYAMLQTGDTTHKSYVTVDLESIYKIIKDPQEILKDEIKVNEKVD